MTTATHQQNGQHASAQYRLPKVSLWCFRFGAHHDPLKRIL